VSRLDRGLDRISGHDGGVNCRTSSPSARPDRNPVKRAAPAAADAAPALAGVPTAARTANNANSGLRAPAPPRQVMSEDYRVWHTPACRPTYAHAARIATTSTGTARVSQIVK
jgi:hypothetical protein